MSIINHTCSAIIPSQKAGSIVQYKIEAIDYLRNVLETSGNYTVKMASNLDFSLITEKIQFRAKYYCEWRSKPSDKYLNSEITDLWCKLSTKL